ncbi:MAG TPA: DUF418 domain-containing protein, partial [Flavisolibacter sp.]|nr:DUF418 domain-containing protein [Flavisolibacter sp.]
YIKSLNAALLLFTGSLIFSAVLEQILHYTFLHTNEYMCYYFPNQLPVFSLGIVAFFVVRDGVSNLSPGTLAVLAFAAFVFSFTEVSKHISLSLGYFLLLLMLAKKPYKFITNSLFANIGRVSFSMYLVHFAVMHWLAYLHWTNLFAVSGTHSAWLNFTVRYLVLFSLSLGLSVLFYRLVEVPFQRMGKRLIERLNFYPVSSLVEVVLQPEPVYAPNLKKTAPLQFFVSLFKKR